MLKIIKRIVGNWPADYKKRLFKGCVYSLLSSVFTAMPVMFCARALNMVVDDYKGIRPLITADILTSAVVMLFCVWGRFFMSYKRAVTQESIGAEHTADERIKIGDVLKRVSLGFFDKNNAGELASAVTTDLSFFEIHMMNMIDKVFSGYIYIAVVLATMLYYDVKVALVALGGVLASTLFLRLLGQKSAHHAPIHQKTIDDMTAATLEYIRGMAVVKAFKQDGVARKSIEDAYANACDINIRIEKGYVPLNSLHLFSLRGASVGVMAVAAVMGATMQLSLSAALMLIIFSFVMFANLERLSDAVHVLENLDKIMNKLENIHNAEYIDTNGKDIPLDTYEIEFKDVAFAYDSQNVVEDITFKIPQNTTTAIVGPSGGGKSTICSLIARFYDVNSGSVKVGGVNVKEMTADSLLGNISMVFQNVYLFRDSILNNIKFGKPNATMEEVVEAAKKARCHKFITMLPEGYDTVIGEGGSTLSGGEKQRISIARAMLKNAPIIILDEATASVDPENEALIQNAIGELVRGKTFVIIAHRLATIENADQILVVENGRIAQRGTHGELSVTEGVYQKFMAIRQNAEGWQI